MYISENSQRYFMRLSRIRWNGGERLYCHDQLPGLDTPLQKLWLLSMVAMMLISLEAKNYQYLQEALDKGLVKKKSLSVL